MHTHTLDGAAPSTVMAQNLSAFITGEGSASPVRRPLGASSLRLHGFGTRMAEVAQFCTHWS